MFRKPFELYFFLRKKNLENQFINSFFLSSMNEEKLQEKNLPKHYRYLKKFPTQNTDQAPLVCVREIANFTLTNSRENQKETTEFSGQTKRKKICVRSLSENVKYFQTEQTYFRVFLQYKIVENFFIYINLIFYTAFPFIFEVFFSLGESRKREKIEFRINVK